METFKLFQKDDERKDAIESLQSLKQHPGWKVIEKVLGAYIDFLLENIRSGIDRDKENISVSSRLFREDHFRDKVTSCEELKSMPDALINKLSLKEEPEKIVMDPFYSAEDIIKLRR